MGWIPILRPGYLGKHRDEKFKEWDEKYGIGNWELAWEIGSDFLPFLGACAFYEDAYFVFLKKHHYIWRWLIEDAANVYDDDPTNVVSGIDYTRQETSRTHIQDIAIRRALFRMGVWFQGKDLIRIRQEKGNHPLSMILSPGFVPFHMPELIVQPELPPKWGRAGSVESFYQSNRYLRIRKFSEHAEF